MDNHSHPEGLPKTSTVSQSVKKNENHVSQVPTVLASVG